MSIEISYLTPLLQVFDMPASLRFYRDALGFEVVQDSGGGDGCDWVWLRLNDSPLMLNTKYERDSRPDSPDPAAIAAHNDTCLYFGVPDPDAVYEHLRAKGLEIKPPATAPYGVKQLYLHDPDGYGLCFQCPYNT
jgi:glyoxylase I family protein